MSTQKRARACDACHAIKIKCELGSTGGSPPCSRCQRLNKDCIITPPKRQKDRVAELEAKVEALTRLLQAQGLTPPESTDTGDGSNSDGAVTPITTSTALSKKRRLDDKDLQFAGLNIPNSLSAISFGAAATRELDQVVSVATQAQILHRYVHDILPRFPFVPIPGEQTLEILRSTRPLLLQAIVYAACPGILPAETQDQMAKLLLDDEASSKIAASEKSIELVQALQIASLWYWAPKHHKRIAVYPLVQLTGEIAISMGLNDTIPRPTNSASSKCENVATADAWRAWLVCYMLSAGTSIYMRRSNTLEWTQDHDDCVGMLEYSPTAMESDRLLCQYIRAERLCEQIVFQLHLDNIVTADDVGHPIAQGTMNHLSNRILDWKAQVAKPFRQPSILFWQSVANIYLHETVLHTPGNKQTFAAPFVAERLSVTDFPVPFVTPDHVHSVLTLKDACHELLETFMAFDLDFVLISPGLIYSPRAGYALYLLTKLYVACSAPGNTYSSILHANDLRVEQYYERMAAFALRLREVDTRSAPAVILSAVVRMEEWLNNFKSSLPPDYAFKIEPSHAPAPLHLANVEPDFVWDELLAEDYTGLNDLFAADLDPSWLQYPNVTQNAP